MCELPLIERTVFIEKCVKAIETKAGKIASSIEFENMPKRIIDKYDNFLNQMRDVKKIETENCRIYQTDNDDYNYIKYRCRKLTVILKEDSIRMNVER